MESQQGFEKKKEKMNRKTEEQTTEVESKKEKKRKKEKRESLPLEVAESIPEESQTKKEKKHKKKKQKVQEEETQSEPVAEESIQPQNGNSKKKKGNVIEDVEATMEAQEEKKKKKKDKSSSKANGEIKNLYQEDESLAQYTGDDVNQYRKENGMTVSYLDNSTSGEGLETEPHIFKNEGEEDDAPFKDLKPIRNFTELSLNEEGIKEFLISKNFKKPTPIQSQCWPFLLSGLDVVGIAETGSGKTLAFTVPGLVHIKDRITTEMGSGSGYKNNNNSFTIMLVLSPTRELAMQTQEVCVEIGSKIGIRSVCLYGGISKDIQYKEIKNGGKGGDPHIIVATPGRLLDFLNEGTVNLEKVSYLVLDEADRMLDKGFEPDIKAIMKYIKRGNKGLGDKGSGYRQTVMFSATWPISIKKLAYNYLSCPIRVTVGSPDLSANHKVTQTVEVLQDPRKKDTRVVDLLKDYHKSRKNRIIIFVLYKKEAARVERMLQDKGFKVVAIHGDMTQIKRIEAINEFKSGNTPLLVATDVAARGLDIPDVEYVINYTFPLTVEDYVHRIGRTGRAGKSGHSYTFFTDADKLRASELCGVLQEANQDIPDDLRKLASYGKPKKSHNLYGDFYKEIDTTKPQPKKSHIKFD